MQRIRLLLNFDSHWGWLKVIWPFLSGVVLLVGLTAFSLDIVSSARAYVGGEGLWSKAQQDAEFHLSRYAVSHAESDYQEFLRAVAVPLGDRKARVELKKPEPDLALARQGFLEGRNHPDDVDGMIRLFRNFRDVSFMKEAIAIWEEGDRHFAKLSDEAATLHAAINAGSLDPEALESSRQRIRGIDVWLRPLKDKFSFTLGEASRKVQAILFFANLAVGALLITLGSLISRAIINQNKKFETSLRISEERLQLAMLGSNDGFWDWNIAEDQIYYSPRFMELLGYPYVGVKQTPVRFFDYVHADDIDATRASLAAHLRDNNPFDIEFRIVQRTGKTCWVHVRAQAVRDKTGKAVRMAGCQTDITDRKQVEAKLAYQASHDELTGLVNRREFERRLTTAMSTARNLRRKHAVLYLDLDQFKIVNDTCGHAAGDELIRQISVILRSRLREGDTLARLGGDEFGVLLVNCRPEHSAGIAEALRQVVADFRFCWTNRSFSIGCSIGLINLAGGSLNLAQVMSAVDAACYMAKEQGRNRVHEYRQDDQDLSVRHAEMQWVSRINDALANDRFCLYSQEIGELRHAHRRGHHFEILLRMLDERGNLIPPQAFIPAAERYSLMPMIDRWVVKTAFSTLARLRQSDSGMDIQTCAINISGTTIGDNGFLDFVHEQQRKYGIDHQQICFEITETAAIANLAKARDFVQELRAMGFRFALDDFGAGMSSFAYLKHIPVDFIKIDGGFVKDLLHSPTDQAMVEAINKVGHLMGKKTIAEFAENEQIIAKLAEMGVDFAQGYGIGRPQPFSIYADRIDRQVRTDVEQKRLEAIS